MKPEIQAGLRNVLAKLYPDERSIRRIVDDSGINSSAMHIDAQTINSWHSVLTEAAKNYQIEELLKAVEVEYPRNQPFHDAYRAYRQLASVPGLTDLVSSSSDDDQKSQHKPRRQWLLAFLGGLVVIGFIGMRYWGISGPRDDNNNTPAAIITMLDTPTLALTGTEEFIRF